MREQKEHVCMQKTEDCGSQHPGKSKGRKRTGWHRAMAAMQNEFQGRGGTAVLVTMERLRKKETQLTIQNLTNFFHLNIRSPYPASTLPRLQAINSLGG